MKNKILGILIIITILTIMPITIFAYSGIDTNITIGNTNAINSSVVITNRIVGTLQAVGSIIAVLALIIIGMRYMFSSIEEKAQLKGVLGYYITGCVLVFATVNVIGFAYDVITDLEHNYEVSETIAATCSQEGKTKYECKDCEKKYEVTIPKLAHSWNGGKTETNATCTKVATKKYTCTSCNATEIREVPGTMLAHDWEIGQYNGDATCTKLGTRTNTCKICKTTETIDIPGVLASHKFQKKIEDKYAVNGKIVTCKQDGEYYLSCSECGKARRRKIYGS